MKTYVWFPHVEAGGLIGRKGEHIKELGADSGTDMEVAREDDRTMPRKHDERYLCIIARDEDATDRALETLVRCEKVSFLRLESGKVLKDDQDLARRLRDREKGSAKPANPPRPQRDKDTGTALPSQELRSGEVKEDYFVPDRLVGLVIGTNGETISGIQSLTKTKINCAKFCAPGRNERQIEIIGPPENIEDAKARIASICEEVGWGAKPKQSELKAMKEGKPLPNDYQDPIILARIRKLIDYDEL